MTDVDVVVTHYNDPARLTWVLEALAAQDHPGPINVVVADDGSDPLPDVPPGVALVTQEDRGFRAAAARNLGAKHFGGSVVLFLDGDTVPEPGYVRAMVDALQDAGPHGMLAVGRRRHATLTEVDVPRFVAGDHDDHHVLADPTWLAEGYARTNDLRDAGAGDWRLVISAVMGMTREAFERIGGFDETLTEYGGEDWDLAYRAWNTGVTLRHVPTAIAWHDGPDAGERPDLAAVKEHEQVALAARIPQPLARGRGGIWALPRVVVRMHLGEVSAGVRYAVLESWLRLGDVTIHGEGNAGVLPDDPRVCPEPPTHEMLIRAEFVVDLTGPSVLLDAAALLAACHLHPRQGDGVHARRTRDDALGRTPDPMPEGVVAVLTAEGPLDLEAWGRRWWT